MGFFKKESKKKQSRLRRTLIVTSALMLFMSFAPAVVQNQTFDNMMGIETVYAAEATYSANWQIDAQGNWRYYDNGTMANTAWVHDGNEWYLLGSDGLMRTGIFQSNEGKFYLLDTIRGTGTYGKLLRNGSVYNGVTLKCDTSAAYEGALSQETINALSGAFNFSEAPYIAGTKWIEVSGSGSTAPSGSTGGPGGGEQEKPAENKGNGGGNSDPWGNGGDPNEKGGTETDTVPNVVWG